MMDKIYKCVWSPKSMRKKYNFKECIIISSSAETKYLDELKICINVIKKDYGYEVKGNDILRLHLYLQSFYNLEGEVYAVVEASEEFMRQKCGISDLVCRGEEFGGGQKAKELDILGTPELKEYVKILVEKAEQEDLL